MILDAVSNFKDNNFTAEVNDQKLSFGNRLKQAREKKNISIDQVCNTLKIRSFFIESIEKDDFDKLPGGIYTIGFIQSYAKFLKIDPHYLEENIYKLNMQTGLASSPSSLPSVSANNYFSFWIIAISVISTVLVVIGFLTTRSNFRVLPPNNDTPNLLKTTPSPSAPAYEFDLNILKPSLITFYALSQTWIKLTDNNDKVLEVRLLSPGEVYQIERQEELYLTTSNSQALKVYDGTTLLDLPAPSLKTMINIYNENQDLLEYFPLN